MKFSKADLDLIFKYIAERLYGDKLSSYPLVDKITGRELMPVVQDGDNKNMHSENLVNIPSMAAKFLQYDTLVASSREEMNRGFGSLNQKLELLACSQNQIGKIIDNHHDIRQLFDSLCVVLLYLP